MKNIFLGLITLSFMLVPTSILATECSPKCQLVFQHCSQGISQEKCSKTNEPTPVEIYASINSTFQQNFQIFPMDGRCATGYALVTPMEAKANLPAICRLVKRNYIARLASGGSVNVEDYGCQIHDNDKRMLDHSLCKRDNF